MKKALVAIIGTLFVLFFYVNVTKAVVLTFEDLYLGVQEYDQLPANYAGFNWSDSSGYITKNYTTYPGYVNGTVGDVSIFSIGTNNIVMTSAGRFNFLGAYINIHHNTPSRSVTVEGLLDSVIKYSQTINFSDPYPLRWFDFNYKNIDELRFNSEEYVIVDNLTYQATTPLPDTGQTTSYTDTFGEDSDYTISPPSYTLNLNPDESFDGTTTDNVTGLMWQSIDSENTYNWYEANGLPDPTFNSNGIVDVCGDLSLAGFEDWRLPNEEELQLIINYDKFDPAIDEAFFLITNSPNVNDSGYWSTADVASNSALAWSVHFASGSVAAYEKFINFYIRCVRGGSPKEQLFIDNDDGTITDVYSGLTWQKYDDTTFRSWEQAISFCEGLTLAGAQDWRLPNIKELKSISDSSILGHAINRSFFPGAMSGSYFSSTSNADFDFSSWKWVVDFTNGRTVPSGSDAGYVRCVRGPAHEVDVDNDGVPDDIDNCPNIYNSDQADSDNDEMGDACDGCPNDPIKIESGICGCGISDDDSDGDGTADCIDGCPSDINKVVPGQCGCGNVETDTDSDGIADCVDDCPFDADNDVDEDGICGDIDNCPDIQNTNQADFDGDGIGDICDEDADDDGFTFVDDCADLDPNINPGACDIKGDGIDQDCNGKDRTKGKPCPSDGGGGEDPPPDDSTNVEGIGQTCSDGFDNDDDGLIDCADPGCAKKKSCK